MPPRQFGSTWLRGGGRRRGQTCWIACVSSVSPCGCCCWAAAPRSPSSSLSLSDIFRNYQKSAHLHPWHEQKLSEKLQNYVNKKSNREGKNAYNKQTRKKTKFVYMTCSRSQSQQSRLNIQVIWTVFRVFCTHVFYKSPSPGGQRTTPVCFCNPQQRYSTCADVKMDSFVFPLLDVNQKSFSFSKYIGIGNDQICVLIFNFFKSHRPQP